MHFIKVQSKARALRAHIADLGPREGVRCYPVEYRSRCASVFLPGRILLPGLAAKYHHDPVLRAMRKGPPFGTGALITSAIC